MKNLIIVLYFTKLGQKLLNQFFDRKLKLRFYSLGNNFAVAKHFFILQVTI